MFDQIIQIDRSQVVHCTLYPSSILKSFNKIGTTIWESIAEEQQDSLPLVLRRPPAELRQALLRGTDCLQ